MIENVIVVKVPKDAKKISKKFAPIDKMAQKSHHFRWILENEHSIFVGVLGQANFVRASEMLGFINLKWSSKEELDSDVFDTTWYQEY